MSKDIGSTPMFLAGGITDSNKVSFDMVIVAFLRTTSFCWCGGVVALIACTCAITHARALSISATFWVNSRFLPLTIYNIALSSSSYRSYLSFIRYSFSAVKMGSLFDWAALTHFPLLEKERRRSKTFQHFISASDRAKLLQKNSSCTQKQSWGQSQETF